jgi:single-stranded-DNA-specific exonuclease
MHDQRTTVGAEPNASLDATDAIGGAFPFTHLQRPWVVEEQLSLPELRAAGGFTPLQIQLLHNRGIDPSERAAFRQGDWHATGPRLADLDKAVERIRQAVNKGEKIAVVGDYDCDGITSCALLTKSLQLLGASVTSFIPTREDDGRGLNALATQQLASQGITLLITTDCGTANTAEVELANHLGMQVIVTDHHPLHGTPATALALVNPQRPDDMSVNKALSGVGVAFRLAEALAGSFTNSVLAQELPSLLDLVAIGTIADVVPLTRENWALVHSGLAILGTAPRPGVQALCQRAGLARGQVSERDISFAIAPRLNAAGRLGRPQVALNLLLTSELAAAQGLALELDELNSKRQSLTDEVLQAAHEQIATVESGGSLPPVLIVHGYDWPLGILGLVAGRIAEDHRRPAFVISSGSTEARGSARGHTGVDLGNLLANWPGQFKRFGGHAQAAGFTVASGDLDGLITYIEKAFTVDEPTHEMEARTPEPPGNALESAPIAVDCLLPLRSITRDRYHALRMLAPFGDLFPEPVFVSTDLKILRCWQSGPDGRNLRLVLGDKLARVGFLWSRQGSLCQRVQASLPWLQAVDVVYTLDSYQRRDSNGMVIMPRILTMSPSGRMP